MIDVTRPVQLIGQTGPAEIYLSNESSGYQISNLISDINPIAEIYLSSGYQISIWIYDIHLPRLKRLSNELSGYQISNWIYDIHFTHSLATSGVRQ